MGHLLHHLLMIEIKMSHSRPHRLLPIVRTQRLYKQMKLIRLEMKLMRPKRKKLNEGDENDSPNGEAPDTSLSIDKETTSFIKGGPTLKAGRRIITVNKPKSTNKVLSMEVENPLVNKAGDLISLNINVNKGIKNRGRPKKSATTMSEMSDMRETRDKSKRSADAMSETNGISPEKKKVRSERASDEKIGTVSKHINHITNKKKNKMCIDCKKMEVEGCWFCGKEEHVCEMALPRTQVDYEWLWVCKACHDIVTDKATLIALRET